MDHVTYPRLFQRQFVVNRLGLAMVNPHTAFLLLVTTVTFKLTQR